MQGALADTSPTALWLRLSGQAATGSLLLSGPQGDATLRFVHGDLAGAQAPTASGARGIRLGERLVHAGRLDRPDLEDALAVQTDSATPVALGQVLVDRGVVDADVVRLFLQEQLLEAVTEVIGWTTGTYTFEVAAAAGAQVPVALPVPRVMVEVRRRAAERTLVQSRVPGPTAVPMPTADRDAPPRLSADAFTVLTAVDGLRSVGAIASALGYAYNEASRVIYRLALQGLVTIADANGRAEPTTPTPSTGTVGPTESPSLADEGWADQRHASATVDEPTPWVGWAHGVAREEPPPAATPTPPEPDAADDEPAPEPAPDVDQPAADEASTWRADEDARHALYSELHAVNRGEPSPSASPSPDRDAEAPPAPERAEPEPVPAEDDTAAPPTAPQPHDDLSISDVSDLLRELHALNLDQDDSPGDQSPPRPRPRPSSDTDEARRRRGGGRFGRG